MPWCRLLGIAVVLGLLALPAMAQDRTISGTVTYRERIALPADARLRVTLVRLPGGEAVAGASAAIPAIGSVPIAFSLTLRGGVARDNVGHALLAQISSAGRVLFRNAEPVPVEPWENQPAQIVVRFSPDPPRDASAEAPIAPDGLLDRVWTVTSIGGKPVTGARPLTLSIAADHRAGGSAGCNDFFTEASLDGADLAFGPAAATRMACEPQIMAQETSYLAALAAVGGYEREGTSLRLLDAAGIPLIGLVHDAR